jgi:hypothetical protein
VKPVVQITGWRRANGDETQAWYDKLAEDCRAGRDVPYDSGGEPKLAPQDTAFRLNEDMVLTVVRARVSAPSGYNRVKECCQVFCPDIGETLYVRRLWLTDSW